jgi:hypothetical protein
MSEDHLNHDLRNKLAWMTKQIHDLWALVRRPVGDQQQGSDANFIARISTNTRDGSNWRWTYGFVELQKAGAGYGGWSDKPAGLSDTAYNTLEDQNGASGTLGNGVSTANLGNLTPQPIPSGTRVVIRIVTRTNGTPEYWIVNYANGIDGTC